MVWGFCLDNAGCPIVCVAMSTNIIHGDCLEELKKLEDNSVDAVVTDPPYGLSNTKPAQVADVLKAWVTGDTVSVPAKRGGFMGKDWDSFVPPPAVWEECMRVLKPGGHMAVFAGARTQDLMGLSIRLAGFEIRDTLGWIYGSGMPKSLDVSKAIDKQRNDKQETLAVTSRLSELASAAGISRKDVDSHMGTSDMGGWWLSTLPHRCVVPSVENWAKLRDFIPGAHELDAEVWRLNGRKGTPGEAWEKREVVGSSTNGIAGGTGEHAGEPGSYGFRKEFNITTPASSEAQRWDGWGTALKPAIEPIILARKPLDGTVANNVLAHGVGGLNIDACRVEPLTGAEVARSGKSTNGGIYGKYESVDWRSEAKPHPGRFPANVLLDEHAAKEMDKQSGNLSPGNRPKVRNSDGDRSVYGEYKGQKHLAGGRLGSGGASRFFPVFKYQAKAPKKERPVIEREDGSKIQHPTVKPEKLMSWLVTLITPPGGTVLDPFAGSGTTLQAALNKGFTPIGIEQDVDYIQLIEQRLTA